MSAAAVEQSAGAVRRKWRKAGILLAILLVWVICAFHDTFFAMATIWIRSETFTHGLVVPPVALWLIWRKRCELALLAPQPSGWAVLAMFFAALGWAVGNFVAANSITQLAAMIALIAAVVAVLGLRIAGRIAFPLAFLLFAVPIGEFVMPIMMEWTADFTVLALRLTGIPVFREGQNFVIPSGNWSVVEACSGVRYLIASFMVGTLFAYLNYRSLGRRLAFVALSIAVPIVANWLRAYMIVMLGHLSGNRLAVGVDHLIYGWIFFGVVIILMFAIGARWSQDPESLHPGASAPTAEEGMAWKTRRWAALILAFVVPVVPLVVDRAVALGGATERPNLEIAANEFAARGWEPDEGVTWFTPAYANYSAEYSGAFAKGDQRASIYIAYYRNQSYGRKLVSSTNVLVRSLDPLVKVADTGRQIVEMDGEAVAVRRYRIVTASATSLRNTLYAWQWYWINGHVTTNDYVATLYTVLARLRGEGDDAALVVIYSAVDDPAAADAALSAFVRDNGAVVRSALTKTRDGR